jgi:hypothetical protein
MKNFLNQPVAMEHQFIDVPFSAVQLSENKGVCNGLLNK